MTTPAYKLTYFDGKGRAELAEVEFKDVRLNYQEFAQKKANGEFPYGSVPVLEEGDFKLAQSNAIFVYLAQKFKLWPEDAKKAAIAHSIVLQFEDNRGVAYKAIFAKENKEELTKAAQEKIDQFQKQLLKIKGDQKYILGEFSAVDICIFDFLTNFCPPCQASIHDEFKAYYELVASHPKLQGYGQ